MTTFLATCLLTAASFQGADHPVRPNVEAAPAIKVEMKPEGTAGRILVTLTNTLTEAVNVNLGLSLANGSKLIPMNLSLNVTGVGEPVKYLYALPGVSGRVDDYIVPMAAGSSYSFAVSIADFVRWNMQQLYLPSGRFRISMTLESFPAKYVNKDMAGLSALNVWKGMTTSMPVDVEYRRKLPR